MRSSTKPQRGSTRWYRALGRLHRYTETMRHIRRSPRERTEEDRLAMQPPATATGPTDPEVFNARRPTPRPSPPYDIPANLATITPTHLLALLNEIDEEEGTDVIGEVRAGTTEDPPPIYENAIESPALPPRPTQLDRPRPPPEDQPERPASTGSLVETTYVEMGSRAATRGSTVGSVDTRISMDQSPTPPRSRGARPRHPMELEHDQRYEELSEPGRHDHVNYERTVPIPQGSPSCRPIEVPTPAYYKDYANPDVFPAYRLICHSVWYIQVSPEVIVCPECATAEHTFCVTNRPLSVWRHMHVLAREFCHTTMHCGRCYKLLMKTKRAIDCYQCRQQVIDMRGQTERLVYKVMCEITVPRTIA